MEIEYYRYQQYMKNHYQILLQVVMLPLEKGVSLTVREVGTTPKNGYKWIIRPRKWKFQVKWD